MMSIGGRQPPAMPCMTRSTVSAATPGANGHNTPSISVASTAPIVKRFSVKVWVPDLPAIAAPAGTGGAAPRPRRAAAAGAAAAGSGRVTVPMQGTIVKVLVEVGQAVEAGQPVCVLEAMKMENNIAADKAAGIALDIFQACPIDGSDTRLIGTSDYAATANSDVVVIT